MPVRESAGERVDLATTWSNQKYTQNRIDRRADRPAVIRNADSSQRVCPDEKNSRCCRLSLVFFFAARWLVRRRFLSLLSSSDSRWMYSSIKSCVVLLSALDCPQANNNYYSKSNQERQTRCWFRPLSGVQVAVAVLRQRRSFRWVFVVFTTVGVVSCAQNHLSLVEQLFSCIDATGPYVLG